MATLLGLKAGAARRRPLQLEAPATVKSMDTDRGSGRRSTPLRYYEDGHTLGGHADRRNPRHAPALWISHPWPRARDLGVTRSDRKKSGPDASGRGTQPAACRPLPLRWPKTQDLRFAATGRSAATPKLKRSVISCLIQPAIQVSNGAHFIERLPFVCVLIKLASGWLLAGPRHNRNWPVRYNP